MCLLLSEKFREFIEAQSYYFYFFYVMCFLLECSFTLVLSQIFFICRKMYYLRLWIASIRKRVRSFNILNLAKPCAYNTTSLNPVQNNSGLMLHTYVTLKRKWFFSYMANESFGTCYVVWLIFFIWHPMYGTFKYFGGRIVICITLHSR
jgi:hypothetical protein